MPRATILFADNDSDFVASWARILNAKDYRVLIALSPAQAEELLKQGGVDLAILDVRFNDDNDEYDISGLNLARDISPTIPTIVFSAYPTHGSVRIAFETTPDGKPGVMNFLGKSEGPEAILAFIDRVITTYTKSTPFKNKVLVEVHEKLLERSNQQFEQARRFFDQQLASIGLSTELIENQRLDELVQSLERVNDAIKFPESFGTLRLRMTSNGMCVVDNSGNFHYEIGILPTLLERKKMILDRISLLKRKNRSATYGRDKKEFVKSIPANDSHIKSSSIIKVLFLAANPRDTPQLRLDEEMRTIDNALLQTEFRDKFDIKQHWAVRVFDLQGYLLRHKPDIVHFSGHGSLSSEIILEDNTGHSHQVSPRALSQLFSVLKDNIRCVVLNACYSEQQAQAIAEHIDCVVGMSRVISDSAAIGFAAAFYQGLGFGRDVKTSFDLGCIQIDLENLGEQSTPKLLAVRINPKDLAFVSASK